MAIPVVGFDSVQMVDVSPNPASGSLFLITGVAKIEFIGSATPTPDGWTRDTCSFDVPTPLGQPFLFTGADVRASALVVPATVQNIGSADIGFGVDSTSVVVSDPINGGRKVTLTSLVVTRNAAGVVWRLAFQVNVSVLVVAPSLPQATMSDESGQDFSIIVPLADFPANGVVDGGPYSVGITGLLPPVSVQWTGDPGTIIADPTAFTTAIDFEPTRGVGAQPFHISVRATDQLGQEALDQKTVSVAVIAKQK